MKNYLNEESLYNFSNDMIMIEQFEYAEKILSHLLNSNNKNIVELSIYQLATILEAKINLVPTPKMTALNVLHFRTLIESMEAMQLILECRPTAVELIDRSILDMTKDSLEFSRLRTFVQGDPGAPT